MSEAVKTIVFAIAAVALAAVAYVTQPRPPAVERAEMVGRVLFEQFDDPTKAASLQIVRYDQELGEIHQFEVARRGGLWTIPSHADYPADAEDQLRDAALSLVGLQVLGVATEDRGEHEMFGVLETDKERTRLGEQGVGIMVSFKDDNGNQLAQLIIGKEVRNSAGRRFVRIPGQDIVYDVKIDPQKLSTRFQDWIEPDVLKLNVFDVDQLTMKDYSVVQTTSGPRLELRTDAAVNLSAIDRKWVLEHLNTYRGRESKAVTLLPTEELSAERLNETLNALGGLRIVDVKRKPKGLGEDLRSGADVAGDKATTEIQQDLISKGFYPNRDAAIGVELLSANGEIHARMKDGYRYILRFGGVEGTDETSASGGLNRYLLVTAKVDEIPAPELEVLPLDDGSAALAGAVTESDALAPTEGVETRDIDADERKRLAERERIKKENERKLDEWREKKKNAEAKVNELNARFADWYYVISEDVYRKIHLSRDDIISEAANAAAEGFGVDAFRQLEETGLRKGTAKH